MGVDFHLYILCSCACSIADNSDRTGAKCLSASHIPNCRGLVLHDSHAEILAIRAFNYWLLTECHGVLAAEKEFFEKPQEVDGTKQTAFSSSPFIRRRKKLGLQSDESTSSIEWPPFEIQPDIHFYMYCTCAPCGDASMELCMAAQEDATPWEVTRQTNAVSGAEEEDTLLDGRAHFSLLGVVRRKPSRMDAISTRSKSCSDKLALRQVSSVLSAQASLLVAPTENAYLAGLILPEDEISRVGCERSFGKSGRMKALTGRTWPGGMENADSTTGYQFRPFQVLPVPAEEVGTLWQFAKPKLTTDPDLNPKKSKPANVSAVWTASPTYSPSCTSTADTGRKFLPALRRTPTGLYETIINGVKQGSKAHAPGARGASALSRAKMWALLREVLGPHTCHAEEQEGESSASVMEPAAAQRQVQQARTYEEFKRACSDEIDPLRVREEAIRDAKQVLKGWVPNVGDEDWGLDVLNDPQKLK